MRIVRRSLAVILAALLVAPALRPDARRRKAALAQAVQERVSQDQADRDAILALLARTEVRQIAAAAGLRSRRRRQRVSTLQGQDLRTSLTSPSGEQRSCGGASTVVISTTTIIIVLLIIILIVVIAD
jgi:hypothetical protein